MKKILIKILFRLLKIPIASKVIDHAKMKEWLGAQYPVPSFRNYISTRNLHLLQILGEGIGRDEEYWINVGRRMELGYLLTKAKTNFEASEKRIAQKTKENENLKDKES